ncbi:hypothetical protein Micbo1qcDRAFT_194709 [Microdochium bolleyi]|uniref:Uncharacterized protein n=1 Tax=Microdochium bolleyi TaxID=196109 RepID=A0A136J3F1_9PEZI|nr:hypothetical protein Micbo1qcDRAFT_194709 [Microdochium bolleyi]
MVRASQRELAVSVPSLRQSEGTGSRPRTARSHMPGAGRCALGCGGKAGERRRRQNGTNFGKEAAAGDQQGHGPGWGLELERGSPSWPARTVSNDSSRHEQSPDRDSRRHGAFFLNSPGSPYVLVMTKCRAGYGSPCKTACRVDGAKGEPQTTKSNPTMPEALQQQETHNGAPLPLRDTEWDKDHLLESL